MIDQIIAYNKEFVAQKGYEKYLIDKLQNRVRKNRFCVHIICQENQNRWGIFAKKIR